MNLANQQKATGFDYKKKQQQNLELLNGNLPPPPKLGRCTQNSLHASKPEPMETSDNDQKENSMNNSTDKENTEEPNKEF